MSPKTDKSSNDRQKFNYADISVIVSPCFDFFFAYFQFVLLTSNMSSKADKVYDYFLNNSDSTAAAAFREMTNLYGVKSMSRSLVEKLYRQFKNKDFSSVSKHLTVPNSGNSDYLLNDKHVSFTTTLSFDSFASTDCSTVEDTNSFTVSAASCDSSFNSSIDTPKFNLPESNPFTSALIAGSHCSSLLSPSPYLCSDSHIRYNDQYDDVLSPFFLSTERSTDQDGDSESSKLCEKFITEGTDLNMSDSDAETIIDPENEFPPEEVFPRLTRTVRRSFILYRYLKGESVSTISKGLSSEFPGHFGYKTVKKWVNSFRRATYTCADKDRSGRKKTISDDDLLSYLTENPLAVTSEIAEHFGYAPCNIHRRLSKLNYRYKFDKWVPHMLNEANKRNRVEMCKQLQEKQSVDPFLQYVSLFTLLVFTFCDIYNLRFRTVITGDEKWVWHDNTKRLRHWRKKGDAEGEKICVPKRDIHARKTMLIVFWDVNGVVHREYLPRGMTITADYYCNVLDRLDLAIKTTRPWLEGEKIFFQHDNARPHTAVVTKQKLAQLGWNVLPHPPYSPDLAPSDYYLFRPLSIKLKGAVFRDEFEMMEFIEQFFVDKSNLGTWYEHGIEKLPSLWQACIEANGEYFN